KLVATAVAVVSLFACSSKVKQVNPINPDDLHESGDSDMAAAPEKGPKPVIKDVGQLRHDCCDQCAAALAGDKTGDDPAKIPCAHFTAGKKEECLTFSRKPPMMAADAKTCAAEPAKPAAKPDEE